jgi:hypothetical protein
MSRNADVEGLGQHKVKTEKDKHGRDCEGL